MGKKSRRNKAPKAAREDELEEPNFAEDRSSHMIRYREPAERNVDNDTANFLALEHWKAAGGETDFSDLSEWGEGELETMTEFLYLVVFPAHKKSGLEAALRVARRWPRFKPHWRRVRRRVCDYCGRRNDLSEPRLWVCAGCGVARYCDKECQALDFSHHAQCCPVLARRWDGAGSMPLKLFDLCAERKWDDPAVLPNVRARERLREMIGGVEKIIDEYKAAEKEGR